MLKNIFQHWQQAEKSTYLYSHSRQVSVCECWGGRRPLYTVLLRKWTKCGPTRARSKGVQAIGPSMNHREPNNTEAGGSHGKQCWLVQTGFTFNGVAASRAHQLHHHMHFVWHDGSLYLYNIKVLCGMRITTKQKVKKQDNSVNYYSILNLRQHRYI